MNIEEVHKINLILLKEIDRICTKYDIRYRLEAGTLLGAIRHKGFIPWDDDCDVVFLRDEYEKFKEALKIEKLSEGITFKKASDNLDYFHDFTDRLFYTKEVYREGKEYETRFGGLYKYLWVDLFILDNIDESNMDKVFFAQKVIYGKALGHRHESNYKKYKGFFKNAAAFVLSSIGKTEKLSEIYKEKEKLSTMYKDKKDTKYVYYSNYPIIWMGYKTERKMEEDLIRTAFEDIELPVMRDYDKALQYFYGDYLSLSPKEKQIPEHKDNIW